MARPALLFALLAFACAAAHETADDTLPRDEHMEEGDAVPLSTIERTFRPAEFDEEIDDLLRRHAENVHEQENAAPDVPLTFKEEIVQGFRVQIYATSNIDEANSMKLAASQVILEDSVYVVFDPPVYKVRVGDFPTRLEANRRLSTLLQRGFPDAWVVADRIIRRKAVPTLPEER